MTSFLWPDHDVRQDLGISLTAELPFVPCPRCGVDITDFVPEELAAHSRFHRFADDGLKSIPHQDPRPRLQTISGRQNEFFAYER